MATYQDFQIQKQALIERLISLQNPHFFEQLKVMLDHFQDEALEGGLTPADEQAIAEGMADVAAGRVESWEEFQKSFVKYEV